MKTKSTSHLSFSVNSLYHWLAEVSSLLAIEQVVNVLEDGEWHEFDEVEEKCGLSEVVESILKFLAEYGFVEIDSGGRKVKIGFSLQKFLEETRSVEVEV